MKIKIPEAWKKAAWETIKLAGRVAVSGALGALIVWIQELATGNADPVMATVYASAIFLLDKLRYQFTKEKYKEAANTSAPLLEAKKPSGIIPF